MRFNERLKGSKINLELNSIKITESAESVKSECHNISSITNQNRKYIWK